MIISLNWIKKFTDIDMPVEELATLIGARLVEIEKIIDEGDKYKDVLIVKVVEANKLEESDHLSVVKIDDGGVIKDIERDYNNLIQVVCGTPNVAAGQLVAWLPPKSVVPETYNLTKPTVLDSRELRGVISNGMIASAKELDLFDEHEGILELDIDAKPGASFSKVYELDDFLFDIENKSLTHRPDCFGIIGFAREVAVITGKEFKSPEWFLNIQPDFGNNNEIELNVAILDSKLSSRYQAIVMTGINTNMKSPLQVQTYLSRVGVRPINAVVDATNYLMMLTGQPLHAFDYDKFVKVAGGKAEIDVRAGGYDEELELLDGRVIKLTSEDIVISAGEKAVALAGAMGGASTVIDENTKNIIIESATFNLYNLRATQMRHGIFSEAITRFTKGQPAELTAPVLAETVKLISDWTGARTASIASNIYPVKSDKLYIKVPQTRINGTLGSDFDMMQISSTLLNAEFDVDVIAPYTVVVAAPWWRADIHIPEDVIEEIGRLNGFDNIQPILPTRDFTAVSPDAYDIFRASVRKALVRSGTNEVLTYSFVHGDILDKANQKIDNSYRIVNSISPELQYYRQSLTPSLLGLIHSNIKQSYDNFALFEVNKTHLKSDGFTDENVPVENETIALVAARKEKPAGASYYQVKRTLEYLAELLGLRFIYRPIDKDLDNPTIAPFELRRSAEVIDEKTGSLIGYVGEYKRSVSKAFKLPEYTAGFEINSLALFKSTVNLGSAYKPLSKYPSSERDVCFCINKEKLYGELFNALNDALKVIELDTVISPVDIYQPDDSQTKNITFRIRLTSHDHTLTSDEVTNVINPIIKSVTEQTDAKII